MKCLHASAQKAHAKGQKVGSSMLQEAAVQRFIHTHTEILNSSFAKAELSEAMRQSLQHSDYIFSGLKAFHEMGEAFPSLLTSKGDIKPFADFFREVRHLDDTYNRHYLKAEYNFAHASARSAAKWEEYERMGDRYLIQYRTMKDERVRSSHRPLDGVTLPPSSSFWDRYMPPNGWGCRCTTIQVRRSKHPETPLPEAMEQGQAATENDKRGMFRFNPGKERRTFPAYNPYTIKKCTSCPIDKQRTTLKYTPPHELCTICQLLHKCYAKEERKHYLNTEMSPLLKQTIRKDIDEEQTIAVRFTKWGNKHLYSDTFWRTKRLRKEDLKDLPDLLKSSDYVRSAPSIGHSHHIAEFYYFKAKTKSGDIYLNVGKQVRKQSNGLEKVKYTLYAITDKLKTE